MAFKSRAWRVAFFILLTVSLDQMATLSIGMNLFSFTFNEEHFGLSTSANIVTNFMGTMFLLTLLGGVISDMWWTRFKTILVGGALEALGILLLTLAASIPSLKPAQCKGLNGSCKEPTTSQKAVFFGGLYLIAAGVGGVKANLATMGADQFEIEKTPSTKEEKRELSHYFVMYYLFFIIGAFGAVTGLVYLQDNVSFKVGYMVALACSCLASLVLLSGYPFYRRKTATTGNGPLASFIQVFVAAFRNRNVKLSSPEMLYEEELGDNTRKIPHTDQFRFLDKAAMIDHKNTDKTQVSSWKLCTVTQVEEVKIILRILPIFASTIVLNCLIAQVQTVSQQQGRTMDKKLFKGFEIPPASLSAVPLVAMILLLPLYEIVFVPVARWITGKENGITYLQRISVGLLLAILSMVVAGFVEKRRLHVAKEHGLLDRPTATVPLNIGWITIQYCIIGLADIFTFVGLTEFFYRESPERLRSMSTSLTFVSLALGYFLSSALVSTVQRVTTRHGKLGWLPSNINRGNVSNFYWLLACISGVNFVIYVLCANWYKYRTLDVLSEEDLVKEKVETDGKVRAASVSMVTKGDNVV